MKLGSLWMARMAPLAVVAAVGIAVRTAADPAEGVTPDPVLEESAVFAPNDGPAPGCQDDLLSAVKPDLAQSAPEPVVACLLLPRCWKNPDCDAGGGAGSGRCVRSTCRARASGESCYRPESWHLRLVPRC